MQYYLKRLKTSEREPTIGVLFRPQGGIYFTLELPWKDNAHGISCIPEGEYKVTHYQSEKFSDCFLLHDVPGRDAILIHCGNTPKDTHGCILIGNSLAITLNAVIESKKALERLKGETKAENFFKLTVF